jgi:WD40 repeat protein
MTPLDPVPVQWVTVAGLGNYHLPSVVYSAARELGAILAAGGFGLITGGWAGVDAVVTQSYLSRLSMGEARPGYWVRQILERGREPVERAGDLQYTDTFEQSMSRLVDEADAVVLVSGAGLTRAVGELATRNGVPVLPIASTGGDAEELHASVLENWNVAPIRGLTRLQFRGLVAQVPDGVDATLTLLKRFPLRVRPVLATPVLLRGHSGAILRTMWHPNGHFLATGSVDKTARIWEKSSGLEIAVLRGHHEGVNQVTWSPDGEWLATCSYDRSIRIWSATKMTCVRQIEAHSDDVPDVAWFPDGHRLASASCDRTVAIWRTDSWKRESVWSGHKDEVRRIIWLDHGSRLASCSLDGSVAIIDLKAGNSKFAAILRGPGRRLISLAYSSERELLAACSFSGSIRIWESLTYKPRQDIVTRRKAIRSLSFSGDGRLMAGNQYGSTAKVLIWRTDNWELVWEFEEPTSEFWPCNIAWCPTAPVLATLGEMDHAVRLWQFNIDALLSARDARTEQAPIITR